MATQVAKRRSLNFIAGAIPPRRKRKTRGGVGGSRTKETRKKPLILSSQIRRFIFARGPSLSSGENNGTVGTKMFAKQWDYMVF